MVRQHCFSFTDDGHYCVAQFLRELILLRDRPSTESSSNVLTRTEIDFIVKKIFSHCLTAYFIPFYFVLHVRFYYKINKLELLSVQSGTRFTSEI